MNAPARAPTLGLDPGLAQKLLEELVYERVRTDVDLVRLYWFEEDLDRTIQELMDGLDAGGTEPPASVLAASLMERAWQRVEQEWREHRGGPGLECPYCVNTKAARAARRE